MIDPDLEYFLKDYERGIEAQQFLREQLNLVGKSQRDTSALSWISVTMQTDLANTVRNITKRGGLLLIGGKP